MNIEAELKYPLNGDEPLKTLLIGGALLLAAGLIYLIGGILALVLIGYLILPFSIVPLIGVSGYALRISRSTIAGEDEPPSFEDPKDLFVDGLRVFAVGIVYQIPLFVLGALATVAVFAIQIFLIGGAASDSGAIAGIAGVGSLLVIGVVGILSFVLGLGFAYVFPIGLCALAQEGEIGAAFDLGRIRSVATSKQYAVPWLIGYAVYLVAGGIAASLTPLLVGFPLVFAVAMVTFRFQAIGYRDALGLGTGTTGSASRTVGDDAGAADAA